MYFKRKVYDQLTEWKKNYADKYAVLLEGARRVGKSTVAELFARKDIEDAKILLKDLGFQSFCTYEKMQAVFHDL